MHWRVGTVVGERRRWAGATELDVDLHGELNGDLVGGLEGGPDGEHGPEAAPTPVRALAYDAVTGPAVAGERVLLNVSALERGLGTGGLAFVVALLDRLPATPPPPPPPAPATPAAGHLVKARYTPQQQLVASVDEQGSPHHTVLAQARDLGGMPVVVADLHSALPAVVAGIRADRPGTPGTRVAYVMTDGGALPAAFSRTVAGLREAGWVDACITVGQAFGGDLEAVTVHNGLLAARHLLDADVAVVCQGPGNAGTDTPWGFSGVAVADALHAAHVLGGRGVGCLRVSQADPRERHRGVSHHSRTAYGPALLAPAVLPVPALEGDLGAAVRAQAEKIAQAGPATLAEVATDGLLGALRACPVPLSTMGRGLDADPAAFLAAAAAGRYAASLL